MPKRIERILIDGQNVSMPTLRDYLAAREIVSLTDEEFGGLGDDTADNSEALQAAVDSGAGMLWIDTGTYRFNTGITIDAGIRIVGAGSVGAATDEEGGTSIGTAGPGSSVLKYTGSGRAITVIGSGTEGRQGIHFEHWMLRGNDSATDGIAIGYGDDAQNTSICSMTDICIRDFTKPGATGLRLGKNLQTNLDLVYSINNYDGFVIGDTSHACTTLAARNCFAESALRHGWLLQSVNGASFWQCAAQSCFGDGLHIEPDGAGSSVSKIDFLAYYSEDNNRDGGSPTLGTAPVVIKQGGGPAAPSDINFFGARITDNVTLKSACDNVRSIDLYACSRVAFYGGSLQTFAAGWMRATENVTDCLFVPFATGGGVDPSSITGNHFRGVRVGGPSPIIAGTVQGLSEVVFAYQSGIVVITDITNGKSAEIAINRAGGSPAINTCSVFADPDSGFSVAGTTGDSRLHLYNDAGTVRLGNGYGVPVDYIAEARCGYGF